MLFFLSGVCYLFVRVCLYVLCGHLSVPSGTSFVNLLCFFSVWCLLSLCARLFLCALWSPAGKGLTFWLSFVVSNREFVTFSLVSWVRCGT